MQIGKWSQRLIAILGALFFVSLGILFVLGMDKARGDQNLASDSNVLKIHVSESGLYQIDFKLLETILRGVESFSADSLYGGWRASPILSRG